MRHVIVTGDFNDAASLLSQHTATVAGKRLHPPAALRTCCYDPGYGMDDKGAYQFPGDYVLSDAPTRATHRVADDGALVETGGSDPTVGRSDHEPVCVALYDL